jgi:hypothetical protein
MHQLKRLVIIAITTLVGASVAFWLCFGLFASYHSCRYQYTHPYPLLPSGGGGAPSSYVVHMSRCITWEMKESARWMMEHYL